MSFMSDMLQNQATAANEENAGNQQDGQEGSQKDADQHEGERTFTQDEVNDIVQKRLAKERERLSKVFQEEKQVSELEERERNILKRELRADAIEILNKGNLPTRLADLLDYSSEENFNSSMEEVTAIFRAALSERIKPFARQKTPIEGNAGSGMNSYSKEGAAIRKAFGI